MCPCLGHKHVTGVSSKYYPNPLYNMMWNPPKPRQKPQVINYIQLEQKLDEIYELFFYPKAFFFLFFF